MPVTPVVLVLIALGAWTATQAAQQPPAETFRSGREVLTIDTSVRDASGRPLTDLQPADFTVRIEKAAIFRSLGKSKKRGYAVAPATMTLGVFSFASRSISS